MDSGGQGLVEVLSGAYDAFLGKEIDLTVAPVATAFLGQFLSTDYFAASRDLLLHRQSEQLLHQIDLTGLV